MALIKCPECGKEYSNLASACPNCGCPTSYVNKVGKENSINPPVKKSSSKVKIEETETSIIKTYKQLPTIPFFATIFGIGFVVYATFQYISLMGVFSFADIMSGENYFEEFYLSEGELISLLIFNTWTVVSMIGIMSIKYWGLLSYILCKFTRLLTFFIFFEAWGYTWSGIMLGLMPALIYLATFLIEEAGHNAYSILLSNGKITENREDVHGKEKIN